MISDKVEALRAYARARGFQPVAPADADACIAFYDDIDVHVGTRLHAHLLFLSRNKRSFLVPVDGRSGGMAEFLGFPLPSADDAPAWLGALEMLAAVAAVILAGRFLLNPLFRLLATTGDAVVLCPTYGQAANR